MKQILFVALAALLATTAWAQKFAILSDIHVTPGNANEDKLRECVAAINASDADVCIMSGDLTNEGSDEQLRHVKTILDAITKPLYVIPGNHENNWSQSACKTFVDLWDADRFSFTTGNLLVVGLNCGPFMKMGAGHVKQEDLIWLDKTLSDNLKPGMKVFSINHYPLLDDLDNYQDYVNILRKYPVVMHQSGHYHRWKQYETLGIEGIMVRALDMGNGDYGYTVINIDLDRNKIHVYNQQLDHDPELKYAFTINTSFDEFPAPQTDYNVPPQFSVTKLYADNASIFTRLGVDDNNVYLGNSLGSCKAVDKTTGTVKWEYKTGAMLFARPAVDKRYVILPTADRRLVWLDKATGKEVWAHDARGPYVADGIISRGILYQGGYKTMQAWNIAARKLLWEYNDINNYCQASPVLHGNDLIFGAWDTKLRSLDTATGTLNWEWNNGSTANLLSPGNVVPAVTDSRVLIVAPDRVATTIDRATGKQLWREKNNYKVRESLGISQDGKVAYAKTMDGELVAMDLTSNDYRLLWKTDLGLGYEHAPCIVLEHRGYIFTGSRRGMLTVVDADTHQVVMSYKMGSSEVNGFDLDSQGNIYCSLIEGVVYKITVK